MPKNIIICCDGTNNQFNGAHTNVVRAYKSCLRSAEQVTYYDPGVGTMPNAWETSRWRQRWSILRGLAFGGGIEDNITDAYRFLMGVYVPGDRVFIFGFSRGAYTARALAGMLHAVGLLHPGTENLIPYAITYWRNAPKAKEGFRVCGDFKATLARPCPVHFLGLWDTVSSVGYTFELMARSKSYPFTTTNPGVAIVRHAVAIDERRHFFRQNLMRPAHDDQDIKNVWFAGVHADVGGGYPVEESGLAKISFEWMIREADVAQLLVDPNGYQRELTRGTVPDPVGPLHRSLQKGWWLAEFLPARRYSFAAGSASWGFSFNRARNTVREAGEKYVALHESVIDRINARCGYQPRNLPRTEPELRAMFRIET